MNKTGKTSCQSSAKLSEVNVKDTFTSHIDKKIFLTFLLTPYLYTFSLYENPYKLIGCKTDRWYQYKYVKADSWIRCLSFWHTGYEWRVIGVLSVVSCRWLDVVNSIVFRVGTSIISITHTFKWVWNGNYTAVERYYLLLLIKATSGIFIVLM